MSHTLRKLVRTSLPLMVVLAAACQDSTGPGSLERLDAQRVLADYAAVDSVLASRALVSFRMTADGMNAASLGVAASASLDAAAELKAIARGDAQLFAASMAELAAGGASGVPLISDANRGRTYVYDAENDRWVIDEARTDAPATGVRFLIYEPAGAKPDPAKPIGHADLIDLGDGADGIALQLVVVEGDLTVLDYTTTLAAATGSGRVTVDGYLRNQRDRLDFAIDVRGSNVAGVARTDLTFEMGIAARQFNVSGDLHGEKQNGVDNGTFDLTVRHGAQSFRVDLANAAGQLSGFIDLNDAPFAVVSGPAHHPQFTTPTGDPITGAHALVLWRIADIVEDVFDLFEDLIEPIAGLVIIAIML